MTVAKITHLGVKNNLMRAEFLAGAQGLPGFHNRIVTTPGILALTKTDANIRQLLQDILEFREEDFTDDEAGNRNRFTVQYEHTTVLCFIDNWDLELAYGSKEPLNDAKTTRVLNILLPEEY